MSTGLFVVTWGHTELNDISNSMLVKSFKKYNPNTHVEQIHFDRRKYAELEREFTTRYGYQFEFLLYRIYLLKDEVKKIVQSKKYDRVVFCDSGDVTCQGSIQEIPNNYDLSSSVIFGAEKNQWPGVEAKKQWPNYNDYSEFDLNNRYFVNGGVVLTKPEIYLTLLETCIEKVLPIIPFSTHLLCYAGDQGAFTYYYNNLNNISFVKVKLDYGNFLALNTFATGVNDYYFQDNKVYSKHTSVAPCFIHDNGWDHGCPRLNHAFELEKLYLQ
jgi:hypothetical protein